MVSDFDLAYQAFDETVAARRRDSEDNFSAPSVAGALSGASLSIFLEVENEKDATLICDAVVGTQNLTQDECLWIGETFNGRPLPHHDAILFRVMSLKANRFFTRHEEPRLEAVAYRSIYLALRRAFLSQGIASDCVPQISWWRAFADRWYINSI